MQRSANFLRIYGKKYIPRALFFFPPFLQLGKLIHKFVLRYQLRYQFATTTQFLRNRSQLEVVCSLIRNYSPSEPLKIAVIGCSSGPEVYSLLWLIRSVRPELKIFTLGMDISETAIDTARRGTYQFDPEWIMHGLSTQELDSIFEKRGEFLTVRSWITEGIEWRVEDATNIQLTQGLGKFNLVLANKFLINLSDSAADRALRNAIMMVKPNGYLVVTGVNLELKMRLARTFKLTPVHDLLTEIWTSDTIAFNEWPWEYYSLEPLDKKHPDWKIRYSTIFQIPGIISDKPDS